MQLLNDLITAAMRLAGSDNVSHANRIWTSEGGRPCPLGWDDCSQTVYTDLVTDVYDYGHAGGPGDADCRMRCPHRMEEPSVSDEANHEVAVSETTA